MSLKNYYNFLKIADSPLSYTISILKPNVILIKNLIVNKLKSNANMIAWTLVFTGLAALVFILKKNIQLDLQINLKNISSDAWLTSGTTLLAAIIAFIAVVITVQTMKEQLNSEKLHRIEQENDKILSTIIDFKYIALAQLPLTRNASFALREIEEEVSKLDDKTFLSKKLQKKSESTIRKFLKNAPPLEQRPELLNKLTPLGRNAYYNLLHGDSYLKAHTNHALNTLNTAKELKGLINFIKQHTDLQERNAIKLLYSTESLTRDVLQLPKEEKFMYWDMGFAMGPHANGFYIETVRFPKYKIISKKPITEIVFEDNKTSNFEFEFIKLEEYSNKYENELDLENQEKIMESNLRNLFLKQVKNSTNSIKEKSPVSFVKDTLLY